jgi:hypothetical protein
MPTSVVDIDDVAQAVRRLAARHGGAATVAQLRDELDLSERTLQRILGRLVAAGEVFRLSRDRYGEHALGGLPSGGPAREIVRVIERLEADAHISGYDVLAGFAHQFVFDYPHLMCCHPSHADGLSAALVEKKFVVLPAGPGALAGAAMPRTVLLRRQPAIESRALVQGAIATPEKAWVDLLRETRRSSVPFDYGELGRLLRAMSDHALNWRALRSYAARLGYQDWLAATTGERPPDGPAQSRLAAGYAS